MVELFLLLIKTVISSIYVGSMAGGLVQICQDEVPSLQRFEQKMIIIMQEREVKEEIQTAFWEAYKDSYNESASGASGWVSCDDALRGMGSSKQELIDTIEEEAKNNRSKTPPNER